MSTIRLFDPGDGRPDQADTLDWYAKRYREHLALRAAGDDYSPRRMRITLSYLDRFLGHVHTEDGKPPARLGELRLADARQLHLTSWLLANYDHWKKGSTRQDAIGAVLTCFNWLEEQGCIPGTPFRRPAKLRFPRTHHRAMRTSHYRAVYWAARRESRLKKRSAVILPAGKESRAFRLILFAAWHAGVRLIEFRQLEPHEIDFATGVVRIPPEKHKTGRKTGETRIVGVGPRLLKLLRALVTRMPAGQRLVFTSPRGRPWTKDNLGRHYASYRSIAGVPPIIKFCAVRHGYAVRVLADGVTSNKAVADQLGHKGTRMVDSIYGAETRHDAESVRNIAERAERGKAPPAKPRKKPKSQEGPERQGPTLFDNLE
jgi:integrase